MKQFSEYIHDHDRRTECDLDRLLDDPVLFETAVLKQAFSAGTVKAAAVATVVKLSRLRQQVLHDLTASASERALANMIFGLASMLGVAIGSMKSDWENKAK